MDDAMKESVKITVIAAGFREIAARKSPSRPSYLPKTWRAGRDPQPSVADEPQQQTLIQQPHIVQHADVTHTAVHNAVHTAPEAVPSAPPQRFAAQQPVQQPMQKEVAPQPVAPPAPVVRQPSIVQQVARNVSEAIHELPDDLDVPTFLRHRTQKA
jgi:hypothetical protein